MKFFLFGTTLLLSTALFLCDHLPVTESEKEFQLEFLKEYKDKEEEAAAAAELKKEEKQINEENKLYDEGKANFYEKLNAESDVPKDEFEKTREGYISANPERGLGYFVIPESEWYTDEDLLSLYERQEEAPTEWNSVNKNLVTSVKNQAQCGSCSAFSATAVHETCMLMAGAKMEGLDISEQYLIDCGYNLNDYRYGCKGADAGRYLKYYSQSMDGSSPHEFDYRYLNKNPKLVCPKDIQPRNFGAKVASAKNDYFCTEEKLKTLITKYGAVSVAIYASEDSFKNYAGGIYDKCKTSDVNHAVTAVGYGTENGVDYWLIKNSWGEDWGMKGYFKLKRGVGMCGIGKLCFTTVCEQTSGPLSPIPSIPPTSDCKVDGFDMTGEFTTDFKGKEVTIECADGKCKAKKGGFNSPNACMAICGELSCIP